ncbi:Activating molecule in BECN1-regulated autophagy 1 [Gossypium arboreum]|uniref:Activating molecule in BECN1-regulated autophagy 1 n=1 Tax=Gossypium arboreum TaxID=29729 RepID=A0A0B0MGD8_GOSAR|nr:Activating molecule in BECN1-regulated autophagy 1 [Gossypium arboreum]
MGQRMKSTRPRPSHTDRPHARAYLTGLTTALSNRTRVCHTGVSLPSPSLVQFEKGQF